MRNAATGGLLMACLACTVLQAGNAAAQVAQAAWPPAYQAETDLAKLEQELHEAQVRALALRAKATELARASRPPEAKEAELQADEADAVVRGIQARIAVVKGSSAALVHPSRGQAAEPPARGIPPPDDRQAARPAVPPPARVPVAAPPPPAAAVAAADDPNTTLADNSARIDALVQGSAGVSAPGKGKVGDAFFVYLRVSPDKLAALLASLKADHPDDTTQKGQGIRLTPSMTATASGDGFDVSPKDGQVQVVSSTDPTEWQWQVTPTASGAHTLTVTLAGNLMVQGKETPRTFLLANQSIEVAVSPANFLQQNWKWLSTTLALPFIGALWAVFRKRMEDVGSRKPPGVDVPRTRRRQRTDGA